MTHGPRSRAFGLSLALFTLAASGFASGCQEEKPEMQGTPTPEGPRLARDVEPIRRVEDAQPGVFVPPYRDCRPPLAGESTSSPSGEVCTQVAVSGCTEPGKYFPDYASCDVVRSQRPYYPAEAAGATNPDDPRLQDPNFRAELAWVTEQVRATACTCCHDSTETPEGASQWDIAAGGVWTDTASDDAIALFTGIADSSVFGAYPPEDNNGFDRMTTGVPSTDGARMRRFFLAEYARRGLTEEDARAVPPFGGPLAAARTKKPEPCAAGEGIDPDGRIQWDPTKAARYVYVLEADTLNPGAPPNHDRPEGTLWKLDVLASAPALETGVVYGTTPPGSFQAVPEEGVAPALEAGRTYHLYVARDVGRAATNCLFTFGGASVQPLP